MRARISAKTATWIFWWKSIPRSVSASLSSRTELRMPSAFAPKSSRAGRSSHVIGRSSKRTWSMSRRATPLLVDDIWEAIEKVERYVAGLDHDTFIKDDKTIDSVVRNLEIIGEAANRLPEDFRTQHPEVEWRKIVGLRNRIVHDYFNIDVEIVWEIIQKDLPNLKLKLSRIRT